MENFPYNNNQFANLNLSAKISPNKKDLNSGGSLRLSKLIF
jgi:hypothetical protein